MDVLLFTEFFFLLTLWDKIFLLFNTPEKKLKSFILF